MMAMSTTALPPTSFPGYRPRVRLSRGLRRLGLVLLLAVLAVLAASRFARKGLNRRPSQSPHFSAIAHSVDLRWNASPSLVVGYNVYRAEESGGPYTKVNSSPVGATNYKDSRVQAGHTYFY